ncbi:putative leucine-rich repeat-containing, plant-type, leucine-rich repeat domain superfamily [Helianthus annuus]|nr:putative leucine-rich repeat-containing, plant-type, leucine-rich repeat domain superfamily [Helianthus annuus]KAJ0842689.1 putative leucine-rich repeat-containing, plant-type, leucine-rich repeat domain superfamily [Helianthus annuus]
MSTHLCFHIFFIPFCLILLPVSGQCQNDQRSILIQLKNTLHFDYTVSTKLVSWNLNDVDDCCKWEGVNCSPSGQIIGLDLSNETISAGIDDSSVLFSLKNLERLNLALNSFKFIQIPSRFGSLASLSYLNLSNSGFTGQIPGELSQLISLEVLDLSSFFSYGPFQTRTLKLENPNLGTLVQNLRNLRRLYLDNVNISSQKFDWCQGLSSSLPDLEVLSLSNCQLSGSLDESLLKLQSLSEIYLTLNNLSATVPNFFANFKNLTVIKLGSCNLNGTFPEKVLQLQSLQILDLSANKNLSGSLPNFPVNGSLRSLVLSHTSFSGGIPESIGNLKNLSRIDLMRSNFSGTLPKSMEKLTQLVSLDLSSNNLTGQIPSFQMCKNLTHVDLSMNSLSGIIPPAHFQDLQNLVLVDLRYNDFKGSIPSSLFSLQKVQQIKLSNNNFNGLIADFTNPTLSSLDTLDLSFNKLEGEIPRSFFELGKLSVLLLSSNNLNGTINFIEFQDGLGNLMTLDLSFNNFSVITSDNISLVSNLPKFSSLKLASCKLHKFPNLRNQPRLKNLDLSSNTIEGIIPAWIWGVGNGSLSYMNLSHNRLTVGRFRFRHNLPQSLIIHESIGRNLGRAYFFSVSNSLLTGVIPETICNASYLKVLDLSNNRLNGSIPKCLIESGSIRLGVLNLGNNSLSGQIEGTFPRNCQLNTLDLHGNGIKGKIPESLVNCMMLEVLNLGKNNINDTYPWFLGNDTNLRVLVLRSNNLHGSVRCSQDQYNNWSKLQILDIAFNKLSGVVPKECFLQWSAMMTDDNGDPQSKKHLSFTVLSLNDIYYEDAVTVAAKGREMELVKILTLFTSIDISNNQFSGEIPTTIGQLKALYILNVSHNAFTGSIPPSMGKMRQLESLDMSRNKLTGEIPYALTSLTFLSTLNLSYNQLRGRIPTGSQFQTFENDSYLGNKGLCGFPLSRNCSSSTKIATNSQESENGNDWQSILYGMAAGAGSLTVISVLYTIWKSYYPTTRRQT